MEKQKATEVGCQTCKKGLNNGQNAMIVLGIYILLSSLIGTVEIFRYLVSLFN